MATTQKTVITVEIDIQAPVKKVWEYWTQPAHITQWNNASEDWHTPHAENDLRAGGRFVSRMEARDRSIGFDFGGVYDTVTPQEYLEYTLDDNRKVKVVFSQKAGVTHILESFEAENTHPLEMQRTGWQAILDNFKMYTETHQSRR
jgi:uncharacterized protein YndB with AHSA1/START domain